MSSWLMTPHRLPSYFAQDSEPDLDRCTVDQQPKAGPAGRGREAIVKLVRRVATRSHKARKRSAAAW